MLGDVAVCGMLVGGVVVGARQCCIWGVRRSAVWQSAKWQSPVLHLVFGSRSVLRLSEWQPAGAVRAVALGADGVGTVGIGAVVVGLMGTVGAGSVGGGSACGENRGIGDGFVRAGVVCGGTLGTGYGRCWYYC